MSLVLRRLPLCALAFCALIAGKGAIAQTVLPSLSDPAVIIEIGP
jgi:hypothetical protein